MLFTRVLAMAILSWCPSVRLSCLSRSGTDWSPGERDFWFSSCDSLGSIVFCNKMLCRWVRKFLSSEGVKEGHLPLARLAYSVFMTAAIYQKMDTSVGLSTIASLSLGLSMSMAGSGREVICRNFAAALPTSPRAASSDNQKGAESKFPCLPQLPPRSVGVGACDDVTPDVVMATMTSVGVGGALQAGFAGPQRRTSFVGILHQMSAQNKLLSSQQCVVGSPGGVRRLSVGDVNRLGSTDPAPASQTTSKDTVDCTVETRHRSISDRAPGDCDVIASRDQREYAPHQSIHNAVARTCILAALFLYKLKQIFA